jgi:tight adherence protein B
MPLFVVLAFVALFGLTLTAVAAGAHVLEAQRRKRVAEVLAGANPAGPAPQTHVLVQNEEESALLAVMNRLNLAEKAESCIRQAGLDWNVTRLVSFMAVAGVAGALAGWKFRVLLTAGVSAPVLGAMSTLLPLAFVLRNRKKRMAAFEQQFPDALDFLARALKAGHAFTASLEMLATESPEPLRGEFWKVYNEQTLGAPLSEVLPHMGERVPLVDVRFFIAAVLMQRESGGNLGEILTKLASVIRHRFRLKGHVKAVAAHGRITAAVLTILPLATAGVLFSANPEMLLQMAHDPFGKDMIAFAAVAQVAGFFIMRKIVNIKI